MAKPRRSAHAKLDELRQEAAGKRMKQRALEAQLEAGKAKLEEASNAITAAYEVEDKRAVETARRELQSAEADVADVSHRVAAAGRRVARALGEADAFTQAHARDLLAEREQPARTVAAELTASVQETLRLGRAYLTERQAQDQLVAAVPGATPRADGPEGSHPWEPALGQLARAYQQTPELEPPLPRWHGLQHRQHQDAVSRREKLRRKRKLDDNDQAEIDRINLMLDINPVNVEVT